MDKLKQVLSRSKDDSEGPRDASSGLAGQGSHFASAREPSSTYPNNDANLGSTVTGTQTETTGPRDISASAPDPSLAKGTTGPEAGGPPHVGTVGADAVGANTTSGDNAGTAIGTTSTYSTTHLVQGDPTPSVVDSESKDPTTYKRPEAPVSSYAREAGVPEGSAKTAASKAFSSSKSHGEGMPGTYPTAGYNNPYKASNLDPRVDNLPLRRKDEAPASSASQNLGHNAAGAGAATASAGLATTSAAKAFSSDEDRSSEATGLAPSPLTSTANPADHSADYTQAEVTDVPESAAASMMSPQSSTKEVQQPSMVGKILGAVGLGSLAGAGAATAINSGNNSAVNSSEGPVTTTGIDSYRSPSQSGPPPSHHRKESIPTTAYPAGPGSPRPIAPPVGGTEGSSQSTGQTGTLPPSAALEELTHTTPSQHAGRDAAIGAGILGAGVGAGAGTLGIQHATSQTIEPNPPADAVLPSSGQSGIASTAPSQATEPKYETHYGRDADIGAGVLGTGATGAAEAYEYERSEDPRETISGQPGTIPTQVGSSIAASGQQPQSISSYHAVPTDGPIAAANPATTSSEKQAITPDEREDHTKRNAALAGAAGVGMAGAGAYAVKEHAEKEAARQVAERQKEMARQQRELEKEHAARAKEAEKEQKAAEKKVHKDEIAHRKELEKEEKAHQKELEKLEKKHQEQVAAAEKERKKEQERRDEEERKRREKEAAVAAGVGAGAVGAGAAAYEADKDRTHDPTASHKEGEPVEKKPSLLKRIFKRKNKHTGEDEEYEAEEEEKDNHYRGATAAGVAGVGAAGTGATYSVTRDDEPVSEYEEKSGGFIKPSYNPLGNDKADSSIVGTGDINNQHGNKYGVPGRHGERDTAPVMGTTSEGRTGEPIPYEQQESAPAARTAAAGMPATDTIAAHSTDDHHGHHGSHPHHDHHERNRLHKDPPPDHPAAHATSVLGPAAAGTPVEASRESISGLPYDSSRDPQGASRLSEQGLGAGIGDGTSEGKKSEHEAGEEHKKSLKEKLKDSFHLGGGVASERAVDRA